MTYLFYVSICTAGFYLLFHAFYRDKPQHKFNRWYLTGSLLLSWLIPAMKWKLIPVKYIPQPPDNMALNSSPSSTTSVQWDIWDWGAALYLLGLSLMLIRLLIRFWKIYHLVDNGRHETIGGEKVVYVNQSFPISSFLHYILISDSRDTPVSDYEWEHERTHIRQGHTYDLLLLELSQAILWFNPVLLYYRRRMTELHEYLADLYTCQALGQTKYVQYILQQVEHSRPPIIAHSFYSLFKKRIQMMHSSASTSRWTRLLILPLILVALYAFTIKTYPVAVLADSRPAPALDTVPLPDSIEWVDTIVTFDPVTLKESVQIVRRKETMPSAAVEKKLTGIDTIVTFDPETFKEKVIIINHKLGTRDTIQ